MSERSYYTAWDEWFATKHDGTPCEWLICEGYIDDDVEPNNLTMCPTMPDGHKPLNFERHVVLHRFTACSYIEACNKQHEWLGWEPYVPDPDWDVQDGRWRK